MYGYLYVFRAFINFEKKKEWRYFSFILLLFMVLQFVRAASKNSFMECFIEVSKLKNLFIAVLN